jgi:hypothetical protein
MLTRSLLTTHAQLLLIGDSGVGKSCLLLRFAVSPLEASVVGVDEPGPSLTKRHTPKNAGRYLHRELHQHDRRGLCELRAAPRLRTCRCSCVMLRHAALWDRQLWFPLQLLVSLAPGYTLAADVAHAMTSPELGTRAENPHRGVGWQGHQAADREWLVRWLQTAGAACRLAVAGTAACSCAYLV